MVTAIPVVVSLAAGLLSRLLIVSSADSIESQAPMNDTAKNHDGNGGDTARQSATACARPAVALALFLTLFIALALRGAAAADPAPSPRTAGAASVSADPDCPPLLRHTFNSLQTGEPRSLCQYKGHVLLIVNTASYCGYTGQYEGLEALYRKYKDRGLVVVGFPSNDYGAQEPGTNQEIAQFCRTTYGVQFPMFEKAAGIKVAANPLYVQLIQRTGQAPRWNFHKYLVNRSATQVESFGSAVEPGQPGFVTALERMLAEKPAS
jgi:glutathione peroxidase